MCELYRCGWCGQPTNPDGEPLTMSQIGLVSNLKDWDSAIPNNGMCCANKHSEQQRELITREMAMDAGDLRMEGQEW